MNSNFEKNLKEFIKTCVSELAREGLTTDAFLSNINLGIELEAPKDKSHGDIATNASLRFASHVKKPPWNMLYYLLTE